MAHASCPDDPFCMVSYLPFNGSVNAKEKKRGRKTKDKEEKKLKGLAGEIYIDLSATTSSMYMHVSVGTYCSRFIMQRQKITSSRGCRPMQMQVCMQMDYYDLMALAAAPL